VGDMSSIEGVSTLFLKTVVAFWQLCSAQLKGFMQTKHY